MTSKTEVVENEKCNRYKEEMMNTAVEKIQEWDEKTFAKKVCYIFVLKSTRTMCIFLHLPQLYLGLHDNVRKVCSVLSFRQRLDQQRRDSVYH